jgi:hypothetical protein
MKLSLPQPLFVHTSCIDIYENVTNGLVADQVKVEQSDEETDSRQQKERQTDGRILHTRLLSDLHKTPLNTCQCIY